MDLVRLVSEGLQGDRIAPLIQGLHPPYTGYTGLRQALVAYRRMAAAGMLVVSDELSDYQWRPGFKTPAFKSSREKVCRAALTLGTCLGV